MTYFVLAALVVVVIAVGLLLRPLLRQSSKKGPSPQDVSAGVYKYEFERLQADRSDGAISPQDYDTTVDELKKRVAQDMAVSAPVRHAKVPRGVAWLLGISVPVVAVALYLFLATPAALDAGADNAHMSDDQQIANMVDGLAAKLKQAPNNPEGWLMLARSYKAMGRLVEAEKAYEQANALVALDAQTLTDYADVAASNAQGRFEGKPLQLIGKALAAEPNHPMGLWLSGTASFKGGRYDDAIRTWTHLLALLPPGSEDVQVLKDAIEDARAQGGKLDAQAKTPVIAPLDVRGVVVLDAAVKDKAFSGGTVLVIARKPGERMPVAVLQQKGAVSFPLDFVLNEAAKMNPNGAREDYKRLEIEARLSKSGMAHMQAGDLYSEVAVVELAGGRGKGGNVRLVLSKVNP